MPAAPIPAPAVSTSDRDATKDVVSPSQSQSDTESPTIKRDPSILEDQIIMMIESKLGTNLGNITVRNEITD